MRRRDGRDSVCPFTSRHRIGKHADGIVVTPLGLVDLGLVVDHFEIARSALLRQQNLLLGLVQLMQLPVNIGKPQVIFGFVRLELDQLLILLQSLRILPFIEKRLRQAPDVAGLVRFQFHRVPIGLLGIGRIVHLRVSVAKLVIQSGAGRALQCLLQQRHRRLQLAFVHQELRQLLDRALVFRVARQDIAQHALRIVIRIGQPVKPRQPQSRFRIGWIQANDLLQLRDRQGHRGLLVRGVGQVSE